MKKNLSAAVMTIMMFGIANLAYAQNQKSEEALLKMWKDVWTAYQSNNESAMWSFYSATATEVYPDGSILVGKEAIKKGYEEFKTMIEGTPVWTSSTPTITFIEPTVAMLIADIDSDIKLKGGQQIGGKAKFITLVHKVNGKWLIEMDTQVPVISMPMESGK